MSDPRFPAHPSVRHAIRLAPAPKPLPEPTPHVSWLPLVAAIVCGALGTHLFIEYKPDRPPLEALLGLALIALSLGFGCVWVWRKLT